MGSARLAQLVTDDCVAAADLRAVALELVEEAGILTISVGALHDQ